MRSHSTICSLKSNNRDIAMRKRPETPTTNKKSQSRKSSVNGREFEKRGINHRETKMDKSKPTLSK